jgi:hypothetical protein
LIYSGLEIFARGRNAAPTDGRTCGLEYVETRDGRFLCFMIVCEGRVFQQRAMFIRFLEVRAQFRFVLKRNISKLFRALEKIYATA